MSPLVPPAPVPHATPLPLWKLVRQLRKSTIAIWPKVAFEASVLKGRRFGVANILVNDPEGVSQLGAGDARGAYHKPMTTRRLVRPAVGEGVFLAEGVQWRAQRRMLAAAFTPGNVNLFIPHFQAAAQALVEDMRASPRANLSSAFQTAALDAVCRALFSAPIGGLGLRLAKLARAYIEGPGRPLIWDSLAQSEDQFRFLNPRRAAFRRRWLKQVRPIVEARRSQTRDRDPAQNQPADLLDILLAARDPADGSHLGDVEILDQSSTFIAVGFETTARTLFWTAYLISRDKGEQARLRAEIALFPPHRLRSLADLSHWPRLRAVLQESMRLYPPAPLYTRIATQADEIVGVAIAAGTLVMVSPWVMHRHHKLWEQPDAFIPDRFEGKPHDYLTNGAFIPFGAGPRVCIGAAFALAEASVILAALIEAFDIALDDPRPIMPISIITTMPDIEPWFRLTPAPGPAEGI